MATINNGVSQNEQPESVLGVGCFKLQFCHCARCCRESASDQIAKAVEQAWKNRKPGCISFGLGQAVVGHNRLTAYTDGRSRMYGKTDQPDFSHIEGYEDHSVDLLYTWNAYCELTGVLINVAVPSRRRKYPCSRHGSFHLSFQNT